MARIIIEPISKEQFDEIVANACMIDPMDANHFDFPIEELPDLLNKANGMAYDVRYGLFCDDYGEYRLGELGDAEVD